MSDRPKCNACGLEIHRDSSIAYMGDSVRHKHRGDCVEPLKDRIAELDRQLADSRTALHQSASLNADLDSQLASAKDDKNASMTNIGLLVRKHLKKHGPPVIWEPNE